MAERTSAGSTSASTLKKMLRDPAATKRAILIREVLGPPVGLRRDRDFSE